MTAHLELDFSDDGTVTMTHRQTKSSPVGTSVTKVAKDSEISYIAVKAGNDETVTHEIHIGTVAAMKAQRGYAA